MLLFFIQDARAEGLAYASANAVIPVDLLELAAGVLIDYWANHYNYIYYRSQYANRIKPLLRQGFTPEEVADMVGLSPEEISRIIEDYEKKNPKEETCPEQDSSGQSSSP